MDKSSYSEILGKFVLPNSDLTYFLNVIFPLLKCYYLNHLWDTMGVGKITKIIVIEVIDKIVVTKQRRKKLTLSSTKKHILW